MAESTFGFRMLAHKTAVIIGVVSGFLLFRLGLQDLFSVNKSDTWLTILTGSAVFYTLLPLSVLGIFKQRAAAWGIAVSLLFFLLGTTVLFIQSLQNIESSVSGLAQLFLYFIAPPGSVAVLLFCSSCHNSNVLSSGGTESESGDPACISGGISLLAHSFKLSLSSMAVDGRRRKAQWAAIILGLIARAWSMPWAVFSLMRSIRLQTGSELQASSPVR